MSIASAVDGDVVDVDPIAAMFNNGWLQKSLHMVIAAYIATGIAVAGRVSCVVVATHITGWACRLRLLSRRFLLRSGR